MRGNLKTEKNKIMSKINKEVKDDNLQTVETALSKTEQFIEDNQKILIIAITAIVLVVLGYIAFNRYILEPREEEARSQMFAAEQYFARDSFNLALNGSGNEFGFLQIIDEYGMTKSANLANYYAGICYLHIGQFQEAIDYLNNFSSDDQLIAPIALGATGDAYSELGNNDEAAKFYKKAGEISENQFTSPIYLMKAGKSYEAIGDFENAYKVYKSLKENFPKSTEARNADKYMSRAKIKGNIED